MLPTDPRFRLALAGLAAALLLGVPHRASALEGGVDDPCGSRRISRIVIDNGDVFASGEGDSALLRWSSEAANLLHVRTTASFVRRELLFQEGDCLDPFLISESRRLLDSYRFLRDVRITTEEDGGDGAVVHVRTRDEWSTQVDLGVTYDGGPNVERFQVTETNFLGNGVRAEVTRLHRREDRSRSISLSTPRVFGRSDAHIRYGTSPGGRFFGQGVAYPFLGEANRSSLSERYDRSTGFFSFSTGKGAGYSHVLVPVLDESFELAAARRIGAPGRSTILGLSLMRTQMRVNGDAEYVLGGDFDGSAPLRSDLPGAIQRQLVSRGATRLSFHLGTRRYRYVEMEGLDAVRDVQSVGVGFFAGVSVGKSLPVLVQHGIPDAGDAYGRIHGSYGLAVGSSLLHGGITAEAGHAAEGWRDIMVEAEIVAYGRASWLASHTLFFRTSGGGGSRTSVPLQLSLGGREGVRSLQDDEVPGGHRLLFVLEDRIRLDWPDSNAADVGVTLFGDAGRMWAGDAPFGQDSPWYGSVGIGLRLGVPRGTRNIWRPDLVFPVGQGARSPIFRVTFEVNRLRSGFTVPKMGRSRRFNRGPEHF